MYQYFALKINVYMKKGDFMKLQEYLETHSISVDDFAFMCRLSRTGVYNILKNLPVRRKTRDIIFRKTGGKVDYDNVFSHHSKKQAERNLETVVETTVESIIESLNDEA